MSQLTSPIILTIDSDPTSRVEIKCSLSRSGYDVFVADDSVSALEIASQLEIDLIISDVRVANRDGLELIREIRGLPERSDVPAIFTSATQRMGIARRIHDFGTAYHLRKPFQSEVLTELVDRVLWMPHLEHKQTQPPHFSKKPTPLFPKVDIQTSDQPYSSPDGGFF